MEPRLEAKLPESTFDPRQNIDLAETIAYLGELKARGLDNGYRAGIVTQEIFGTLIDFGSLYSIGEAVVLRDSESMPGAFVVGRFPQAENPILQEKLLKETLSKPLRPAAPVDQVPKTYVIEVI